MSRPPQTPATAIYLHIARIMARVLASSSMVESVLLHRSVTSGEISFGRSDIDLLLVVGQAEAEDGEKLASLYQKVRLLRWINPALRHIEVHGPTDIPRLAEIDTFWGSMERRGVLLLGGKPVAIPHLPINTDHAVAKFGFWLEWFFSTAVQERNRRNLRKTALENWNAYATASGLIQEPFLRRSEMAAQLCRLEENFPVDRLAEPYYAASYVFELADRLHRQHLPALGSLTQPVIFEAILAPLSRRRTFVVLPRSGSPLPPEAFLRGIFLATPEALDLYLHYTNAFLNWVLPPELLDLSMRPPRIDGFLRSCRYYGHSRFLRHPGFLSPNPYMPPALTVYIRHALDWLCRGELPPPIPQQEIREMLAAAPSCLDYYRKVYDQVCRESQRLRESLPAPFAPPG